ncbi:MAG: hypothetical protein OSA23_15980 [Rhodospirillales bacterium]|nr:hypothetical protein [Rhodospirillales bacterium]
MNRGGLLKDISTRGAAAEYVPGTALVNGPLIIGEVVHLGIKATAFPSPIVVTFNNGFAVQFD